MKPPSEPCWVVEVTVARMVALDPGEPLEREHFLALIWELLDGTGLCGLHEGTLDAADAFAEGISGGEMVVDAAAGDPARDWVAAREFTTVEAWFAAEDGARSAAATLATIAGCVVLGMRCEAPRDWEAEFRAGHQAIDVPGFGTILPPWSDAPPTAGSLVIDPGTGFGTGLHPTTRLCLAAIAAICPSAGPPPRRVDFGAGSGILGIAAAVRGASVVDAVEIDDSVHAAILHNADLNRVRSRLRVVAVLDAPGPHERYDLAVANIVAPVLMAHAEFLSACLRPGGVLVLSGLLAGDVDDVAARYRQLLGVPPASTEADGWHCLRFDVG